LSRQLVSVTAADLEGWQEASTVQWMDTADKYQHSFIQQQQQLTVNYESDSAMPPAHEVKAMAQFTGCLEAASFLELFVQKQLYLSWRAS